MTSASGGKSKCILCEKIIKKIFNCQEDVEVNLLLKKKQHQVGLLKAKARVRIANKIDVPKITLFKSLRGVEDNPCAEKAFKINKEKLTQAIVLNKTKPKDVKELEQVWIKLDKPIQSQKYNLKKNTRRRDKKIYDAISMINRAANSVQEFSHFKKYTKGQDEKFNLEIDENLTSKFVHINKKEHNDEQKLLTKIETVVETEAISEADNESKNIIKDKEVISKTKHNTLLSILNDQASSNICNRFKNTPIPNILNQESPSYNTINKSGNKRGVKDVNMTLSYWRGKKKQQNKRTKHKKSKIPVEPLYPPFQPLRSDKTLNCSSEETKDFLNTSTNLRLRKGEILLENINNNNVVVSHVMEDTVLDKTKENFVCGSDVFYVGIMPGIKTAKSRQITDDTQINEPTEELKLDMNEEYASGRMVTYPEGNGTVDNSERIGSDSSDVDLSKYYSSNMMPAYKQEHGDYINAFKNSQNNVTTIYKSNNYNLKENTQGSNNCTCDRCQGIQTFYPYSYGTFHTCHRMGYNPNTMKTYPDSYLPMAEEEPRDMSFYNQTNRKLNEKAENVEAISPSLPNIQTLDTIKKSISSSADTKEIGMIEDNPIKIGIPKTKLSLQMLLEEIQRKNRIDECIKCLQEDDKEAKRGDMGTSCPPCPPPPPSCPPPCPDFPCPPACPTPAPKPTSCPPPDDSPPPKKCFQKLEKSDLLSLDPYYVMPNKAITLDRNLRKKGNQVSEIIIDDLWKKLKESIFNKLYIKSFGKHFNYFTTSKSSFMSESTIPFTREKIYDDQEHELGNKKPTVSLSPPVCPPKPEYPSCPKPFLPPVCPPKPRTCYPTPCKPRLPTCKPKPSLWPPKQPTCPKTCPQAECKPKTCPPKAPICTPKAPKPTKCPPKKPNPCAPVCPPKPKPVCPPKTSPCPPKAPSCPPKAPTCPPKAPTCPPKAPTCPPKAPTCPPKAPTCPPKAPTCPPPACPPPCPPKPPVCPPKPCCPKSCCSEIDTPELLYYKLDNITSKPGFIIIPNETVIFDPPNKIFIPKEANEIAKIIIDDILDKLNIYELNKWLVRGFEPWTPIPSWPIPQIPIKLKTPCEEKYCKRPTPPKLSDPCKQKPCTGFPKRSR